MTLINHTLFFILTITLIPTPIKSQSKPQSIYELLKSNDLPSGLFPKGITNFTIEQQNGTFEVYLDHPCDSEFESELHYEKRIFGQLSYGMIDNLSGISAQDLFLWFPVKGIRVDIPSSGVIYFDVGVVRKQFSLSFFENPTDCVVAKDSVEIMSKNRGFFRKLGGALRYIADW